MEKEKPSWGWGKRKDKEKNEKIKKKTKLKQDDNVQSSNIVNIQLHLNFFFKWIEEWRRKEDDDEDGDEVHKKLERRKKLQLFKSICSWIEMSKAFRSSFTFRSLSLSFLSLEMPTQHLMEWINEWKNVKSETAFSWHQKNMAKWSKR